MANARNIFIPKYQLTRTSDCIALMRDDILLRVYPKLLQFQIDRVDSVKKHYEQILSEKGGFSMKVYGLFGYIKLACYSYLIIIEEASIIGQILQANIYKVEKLLFLPLRNDQFRKIADLDLQFVEMIQKIQNEKAFYFSYDMDLTKNIQRTLDEISNMPTDRSNINVSNLLMLKENYPNSIDFVAQYAFNDSLLGEFQGIEYSPFKVPCIFGYVFISSPNFNRASKVDFILISRKDCRRPGRRFVTRGLDREGNAANFVETEHIFVQYNQPRMKVASLVQIRGSIPLIWSMKPNMKWSPPVKVDQNLEDSRISAQMHFRETSETYGQQYLVNLIDKKGSQKRIGDQFTKLFNDLKDKNLSYVWFDFHGECKKMKWENLSKLVDICKDELQNYGYFMANLGCGMNNRSKFNQQSNQQIIQTQKGTFRTNCMDCLDRTNVVQGVFSRYIAFSQLNKMDLIDLPSNGKLSPFQKFPDALEEVFREGWTNNADIMSYLYTGTPALKTDFTRTGKRTHKGAIADGINAVTRYYINNFTDGYYHDCLDIATLKLLPNCYMKRRGFVTPLKVCLFITLVIVFLVKIGLERSIQAQEQLTLKQQVGHFSCVYGTLLLGLYLIYINGQKFIDDASRFV